MVCGFRSIGSMAAEKSFPIVSSLQFWNFDLLHLKHRVHDSFRFFGIFVVQHIDQPSWGDLPRNTEFVLEPAALRFPTAISSEFPPEIIHFLLRFAVYDEGNGFIEFEKRPAVKSDELLSFDFEFNRQHRSDGTTGFFLFLFARALFSAIRALSSFFTNATGIGLSGEKRSVPLLV